MIKPTFCYSKCDFVFNKLSSATNAFDCNLLTCWNQAEQIDETMKYKIDECYVPSKCVRVNNCNFTITLNEKRFSKRRQPQVITKLDAPFDASKFNFNRVKDAEILLYIQKKCPSENTVSRNVLIVNASPFVRGHSLLVPELELCHNQCIRPGPLLTAIETALISANRGVCVAFNSLLACASVNHLHFHVWMSKEPLLIAQMASSPVDEASMYLNLRDHPAANFVVEILGPDQVSSGCDQLWHLIRLLQHMGRPHSLAIVSIDGGLRCIVWPRNKSTITTKTLAPRQDGDVNIACCELAGHIFTGDYTLFNGSSTSLTQIVSHSIDSVTIPPQEWTQLAHLLHTTYDNSLTT